MSTTFMYWNITLKCKKLMMLIKIGKILNTFNYYQVEIKFRKCSERNKSMLASLKQCYVVIIKSVDADSWFLKHLSSWFICSVSSPSSLLCMPSPWHFSYKGFIVSIHLSSYVLVDWCMHFLSFPVPVITPPMKKSEVKIQRQGAYDAKLKRSVVIRREQ